MTCHVIIEKRAEKFIRRQTKENQDRLITAIYKMPFVGDIKPMEGKSGYYRLRVGDFRVIYTGARDRHRPGAGRREPWGRVQINQGPWDCSYGPYFALYGFCGILQRQENQFCGIVGRHAA